MALNHCIKIVFCTKGRTVSRLNRILINGAMKSRPAQLTFPRPQPKRHHVFFNMLRREFVADRDSARRSAHFVSEFFDLADVGPVRMPWRRDCRCPRLQAAHLCNFALHFVARQGAACASFGPLHTLEMERLHYIQFSQPKPDRADARS